MKIILISLIINLCIFADTLKFGAISTVDKIVMEKKLTPLMQYISDVISKELKFETGFNYTDTIDKFKDGTYDLGFIGPSPFVIATNNVKNKIKIIAGLNNKYNGQFHSVIVVRKNSNIEKLSDLKEKSFAFGSPESTLSYFMPMNILKKNNIDKKIAKFNFLGNHDRVAKYVIMGKYDAGGIKESVAKKYSKYLKIIYESQKIPDFIIVASAKTPDTLVKKIQDSLLKPEASKLAKFIKPSATGFRLRKYSDYDKLKEIMININPNSLK